MHALSHTALCMKQNLYNIISEFRRKNARARISQTAFMHAQRACPYSQFDIADIGVSQG